MAEHATRVEYLPEAEERFWAKVDRRGDDDCWLWQGLKNAGGYGRFSIDPWTRMAQLDWYHTARTGERES